MTNSRRASNYARIFIKPICIDRSLNKEVGQLWLKSANVAQR